MLPAVNARLRAFLIDEKGFNPDRVLRGIEKLKKAKGAQCVAVPAMPATRVS